MPEDSLPASPGVSLLPTPAPEVLTRSSSSAPLGFGDSGRLLSLPRGDRIVLLLVEKLLEPPDEL